MSERIRVITFYEFRSMPAGVGLITLRDTLRDLMRSNSVKGTVILAQEGFNAMVCGGPSNVERFVTEAQEALLTKFAVRSSEHDSCPFRRAEVRIRKEIVSLKQEVDISKGSGIYVSGLQWNEIITDPETFLLDARNDYEFKMGRFAGAVNPGTSKFSELPEYIARNLDPARHRRVAMYCTGGIRCEKLAPYLKGLGFSEVYQLQGGILEYLKVIRPEDSLWSGECFVFDDRVSLNDRLEKGSSPDLSQKTAAEAK